MKLCFLSDFVFEDDYTLDNAFSSFINQCQASFVNFEAPVIDGTCSPIPKGINLFQRGDCSEFLSAQRVRGACLANNHVFDFGVAGFERTRDYLESVGVRTFGAGRDLGEAMSPALVTVDEKVIALWGFAWHFSEAVVATRTSPGVAPVTASAIRQALSRNVVADLKVVYLHYGIEYEDYPDPYQKYISEMIVEEGLADVVIGTHPHCPQGWSSGRTHDRNRSVFYSLGNFIFPQAAYGEKELVFPGKSLLGYAVAIDLDEPSLPSVFPYEYDPGTKSMRALHGSGRDSFMSMMETRNARIRKYSRTYGAFYLMNRLRWHFPVFSKHESLNDFQIRIFRFAETVVVSAFKRIGLFEVVKKLFK